MKKEESTDVKLLHKKFPYLSKPDINIIFDFCDQDPHKTEKILTIAKETRCPNSIIRTLLERPQKGYSLLASFQKRYDEQYRKEKIEVKKKSENEIEQKNLFNFFKYIPNDLLLSISIFLDPYSMANFSITCSKILKVYNSEAFNEYFRVLCVNLFQKTESKLPEPCRYGQVKDYIFRQGKAFGPNTRNAVTNNLRYYVWQKQTILQKKEKSYLQSFGNYRNLYFKLPRVHFNGLYMCKHQYLKEEERNLITNTMQVHYVTHYRYFRFFADGTILSAFFPTKQKMSFIADIMNSSILQDRQKMDSNVMIGQYLQTGNKIEAKLYKQGAIFTYLLEIKASQKNNKNQISESLVVKLYVLKVLDENEIVQVLEQENQKFPMHFKYLFIPSIRKQNQNIIKSSSL